MCVGACVSSIRNLVRMTLYGIVCVCALDSKVCSCDRVFVFSCVRVFHRVRAFECSCVSVFLCSCVRVCNRLRNRVCSCGRVFKR